MGQWVCDMCVRNVFSYLHVCYLMYMMYLLFKQLEKTVSDVEEAAAQSYEISALTDGNIISICLHHM